MLKFKKPSLKQKEYTYQFFLKYVASKSKFYFPTCDRNFVIEK